MARQGGRRAPARAGRQHGGGYNWHCADEFVNRHRSRAQQVPDALTGGQRPRARRLGRQWRVEFSASRVAQRRLRTARPASTSSAPSVRVAPWRIRSLVPRPAGRAASPAPRTPRGPARAARRAVISEPERSAASTTTTPSDRPEMIRLRRGKVAGLRRRCRAASRLTTQRRARRCASSERAFSGGIDDVDAAGQHGDGAGRRARLVRRGVDAARQARDDDEAGLRRARRRGRAAKRCAGGRGVARADDGDGAARQQLAPAARPEISGGVGERGERGGIVGFAAARSAARRALAARGSISLGLARRMRIAASAPPRRARSGSAASAARAPSRSARSSWQKVTGPTFSVRDQAQPVAPFGVGSASLRSRRRRRLRGASCPVADPRLLALQQAADVGRMRRQQQRQEAASSDDRGAVRSAPLQSSGDQRRSAPRRRSSAASEE